jgi:hypothetical protein
MYTAIHTTAKRTLWTPDHDDILKERFHTDCLHDIASHIGCTRSTSSRHARRLGLRKETPSGRNRDARCLHPDGIPQPQLSGDGRAHRTEQVHHHENCP